jgi:hypothetical protein
MQLQALYRFQADMQMALMRGIERAAEQADAHRGKRRRRSFGSML